MIVKEKGIIENEKRVDLNMRPCNVQSRVVCRSHHSTWQFSLFTLSHHTFPFFMIYMNFI